MIEVKERKIWQPRFFTPEEALEMVKLDALPTRRPLFVLQYAYKDRYKEHTAIGYIKEGMMTIYAKDGMRLIIPLSALDYIKLIGEVMG